MITADQAKVTTANNRIRLMVETQREIESHEGYSKLFSLLSERITFAASRGSSRVYIPLRDLKEFDLAVELSNINVYLENLGYHLEYSYWDDEPRDLVISW
jgi:hypothetical protein